MQDLWRAPTVTGLVEVETHAIPVQVDDVGGAGAVDIGEADALVVELVWLVWLVEVWRVIHGDLGAETTVTQIGPVADLAIADTRQVSETVAAEIGQIDGLGAIGKDQARAFFLIQRLLDATSRAKACLG
jgi:hypothetical protein